MVMNPFTTKARLESLKNHGKKLLRDLLRPEDGFGGHLTLISGPIGTGKTSLLLTLAKKFADAGYYVIYRGREAFELYRLPGWEKRTEVYVPKNHVIHFIEHNERSKELKISTIEYSDMNELLANVQPGKINVIFSCQKPNERWLRQHVNSELINESLAYRETAFWVELFDCVIKQLAGKKVVIMIDEGHELFPAGNTGLLWHLIDIGKRKIADFRKYKLNLIMSTHDPSDLDWRINRKFDFAIYLRGSRTLRRLVRQKYTYRLDGNAAFIEGPAEFGLIKFKKLKETRVIIATWRPTKPRADWENRKEIHLKTIYEVAKENDGLFRRMLVKEKLGDEFNKLSYNAVLRELKEKGLAEEVKRGIYWFRGVGNG